MNEATMYQIGDTSGEPPPPDIVAEFAARLEVEERAADARFERLQAARRRLLKRISAVRCELFRCWRAEERLGNFLWLREQITKGKLAGEARARARHELRRLARVLGPQFESEAERLLQATKPPRRGAGRTSGGGRRKGLISL